MSYTIEVDRTKLVKLMKQTCGLVANAKLTIKYSLGAKPRMGAIPGTGFRRADCSGYVRWLLNGCSNVTPPDGSWYQREWCRIKGFAKCSYKDAALLDSKLRIAFIVPQDGKIGHVWLVINGLTIESYGGFGAGRRKWDTPVLKNNVNVCYVLTDAI